MTLGEVEGSRCSKYNLNKTTRYGVVLSNLVVGIHSPTRITF